MGRDRRSGKLERKLDKISAGKESKDCVESIYVEKGSRSTKNAGDLKRSELEDRRNKEKKKRVVVLSNGSSKQQMEAIPVLMKKKAIC